MRNLRISKSLKLLHRSREQRAFRTVEKSLRLSYVIKAATETEPNERKERKRKNENDKGEEKKKERNTPEKHRRETVKSIETEEIETDTGC